MLDALGGGQGAQAGPAGKAGGLPFGPLSGADEIEPKGEGQRRKRLLDLGLSGGKQPLAGRRGQLRPPRPVAGGRTGPEGEQFPRQGGKAFRQHGGFFPHFCWYSRGLRPVDFLKTLEK